MWRKRSLPPAALHSAQSPPLQVSSAHFQYLFPTLSHHCSFVYSSAISNLTQFSMLWNYPIWDRVQIAVSKNGVSHLDKILHNVHWTVLYSAADCSMRQRDWGWGLQGMSAPATVCTAHCLVELYCSEVIWIHNFVNFLNKLGASIFFSKKVPFKGTGTTKPEPEMGWDELLGTGVSTIQKIVQKPAGVW